MGVAFLGAGAIGRECHARFGIALVTLVCATALVGCSSKNPAPLSAGEVQGTPASAAGTQSSVRTRPPTAFEAAKGTPLPSAATDNTSLGGEQQGPAPIALHGYTAFVTTGTAVQVVNTATGRVNGSVKPLHQVPDPADQGGGIVVGNAAAPPLVEETASGPVALAGYVVQIGGHGTTPSSLAVEVDAITTDAQLAWDIIAPLPGQPGQTPFLSGGPDVDFIGLSGGDVIANVGDAQDGFTTIAFDIVDRRSMWQNQALRASAVVGGMAIGTTDSAAPSVLGSNSTGDTLHLAGVSVAQGTTEWQQSETIAVASVQQAGPELVMVEATDLSSGNDVISVLKADTGKGKTIANQSPQGGIALPWDCRYDGQSAVVCDNPEGMQASTAFAVDGPTGNTLWTLPDPKANRTALTITAVYDGMVYGTTASGPVVLDAQTGKDVNDSPGVAPVMVDPDVGVAESPSGTQLKAYPATP
jgi:hypothetical protein